MIPLTTTLAHGLLICLPFSLFALVTFARWPRLWLHSLPPDIAALAGPKTPAEQRQTRFLLIPLLLILPGLSTVSTFVAARADIDLSFLGAALHLYGVWVVVHLWDFLVIDCGYALLVDPSRPPIAGTAGAAGYRDYRFHFHAFLKAVLMSAIFVVPAAWVISLLT